MKQSAFVPVALLLFGLLFASELLHADDQPNQQAELATLRKRVDALENELRAIRRELAALKASMGGSIAGQGPATRMRKKLDIRVVDGGWGNATSADIRAVCLSAGQELWKHFPDQVIDPITIRHSAKGPMVIYGRGSAQERRVLLNVNGTYWAQFAYQFPHELCHILCNYREANNPNLWFEESICEAASLFALKEMAETWKTNPPYPNWKGFSVNLSKYAEQRLEATKLEEASLAEWYRNHAETLQDNGTDRAKNLIVATAFLKLVEKNPRHWRSVRYLNQWDKDQLLTFEAYMVDWYRRVPEEHRRFVADVGKLFEISLTP